MKKHMIRGQWCIYRLRKKTTRWFHHLSIWVAFCRYRHNFDIGFALLGPHVRIHLFPLTPNNKFWCLISILLYEDYFSTGFTYRNKFPIHLLRLGPHVYIWRIQMFSPPISCTRLPLILVSLDDLSIEIA